ncbi:MAG: hypothetical protein HQ461_08300 [Deltaproteobacteria bacterium]|nr:hypothetical protein [Deltaproteobacteria bacterium]
MREVEPAIPDAHAPNHSGPKPAAPEPAPDTIEALHKQRDPTAILAAAMAAR